MRVTLHVLHVPDCPNLPVLLERLRQVTDLPVTTREITTDPQAAAAGMRGSPTLLVNGRDSFGTVDALFGLSCRIYRDDQDRAVPVPSVAQLRATLAAVTADTLAPEAGPPAPTDGGLLAGWRDGARPTDPVDQAVHRAILRAFATTSRPPTHADLDPVTAGSHRTTTSALAALHDLDAIRLSPDGQIAVAYPFSATPTRHRVRITGHTEHTEAYAMCAIDSLGIAAMLGADTRIDSTDVTNGQPVNVTTTDGHTRWEPAAAVVFVGADAGGSPSAECCCDYLNFFTDEATARAWTLAHPHIPGHILTQTEAETLGTGLFGRLLADP